MRDISKVKVAVYEPDQSIRPAVRGMLRDIGFSGILDADRPQPITEAIVAGEVDLLLCDMLGGGEAMRATVRGLRFQTIGDNPFPIVVGMIGNADKSMVSRALEAGLDSLVLKPAEMGAVRKRVQVFLNSRMPFVVAAGYVGPDRRRDARPDREQPHTLDVPNPVRMIAEGMSRRIMHARISEARAALDDLKLRRDAVGVHWLADRIGAALAAGEQETFKSMVAQLAKLAQEIDRRLTRTCFGQGIHDQCITLIRVAGNLEAASEHPDPKDVRLLVKLAETIDLHCQIEPAAAKPEAGAPGPVHAHA